MKYCAATLPSLAENLALDEALLMDAEAGGPEVLRVWAWPAPAVVLGAACRLADDVNEDACRAEGVPILRRSSGGGTVLLGPGCLLFSLILRFDRDLALAELHASYQYILARIQSPLQKRGIPTHSDGLSDLTWDGRKFSGNAQQRKRTHFLHHGSLLHAFDFSTMSRYLRPPLRQPEYRQGRGHQDFLTNVPVDAATLSSLLREAWGANESLSAWPESTVRALVAEKYAREEWIRRR